MNPKRERVEQRIDITYDQLTATIKQLRLNVVPVGTAVLNLRSTVPAGWLEINPNSGATQTYSVSKYPQLAEVIQNTTGENNGVTFKLPAMAEVGGFRWIIKSDNVRE